MDFFVLDACALIAYFKNEEGREKVVNLFNRATDAEAKVLMHAANVSEVYYDFWRASDKITADTMLADLLLLPIELINTISTNLIQEIGYFKTKYKVSFADTFVLATAKINDAKVVTSDHHEFDGIEKSGDIGFEWIR